MVAASSVIFVPCSIFCSYSYSFICGRRPRIHSRIRSHLDITLQTNVYIHLGVVKTFR